MNSAPRLRSYSFLPIPDRLSFDIRRNAHPCFSQRAAAHRDLHSFPTRRSSDLERPPREHHPVAALREPHARGERHLDRKSTRLNSSHRTISYAVFCLKKKTSE